ncbi:MAG: type 1 glutamine amidotransferase [Gammaproteobacteria bacterium]|nr:type 1 glutamine amidotransferase [Gammaproteobacteria bacterium]
MRLLVFQHIECEHPGVLRRFLEEDHVRWDSVELDKGDQIPDLESYDALWVMGGPMDVWDVEQHPWLIPEKQAIRHWVSVLNKPYLGLCLGHQLLADALGGTCGPQNPPEIGVLDVTLTKEGKSDPIFHHMPETQKCLQWHSVCVAQPPENTVVLASSRCCRVQAMHVGDRAWSMQYHVEIEPDTVDNWGKVPEYKQALENTLGPTALDDIRSTSNANMDVFLSNARQLYRNFMMQCR